MPVSDMTLGQAAKTIIECYQLADYTGVFVQRDSNPKSCIKTPRIKDDDIGMLNSVHAHFEQEFISHYFGLATLVSQLEPDLLSGAYKVVQESGDYPPKISIVESDFIPPDTALKVVFQYDRSPRIYLYHLDNEYLYWNMALGMGYSEKFNLKYSGSVLDGMLEGANG